MVIKTEQGFSAEVQKELEQIYNQTATTYGFTGQLSFASYTAPAKSSYTDISKILGDGIVI